MALIFTGIVGSKTIIRTASTKLNINVRLSFFSQQLSPCTSSLLMIQLSCRWLLTSFRASFLSCSCLINSASLIFICSSIILLVSFICTTVSSWFKKKIKFSKKCVLEPTHFEQYDAINVTFWQVKIYQIMFTTGPLNMQCVSFISKVYQQHITFLTNIFINWIYMCRYIWSVLGTIVKRWICL